jgi:hypothetical protein
MSDNMIPFSRDKHTAKSARRVGDPANVVPLREVMSSINIGTIECLERLLKEAKEGKIIGIAFAALMKQQCYVAHTCGEVQRQRVLTRGILRELDDMLARD